MQKYKLILNKVDGTSETLYFDVPYDPGTYQLKFFPKNQDNFLDGGKIIVGNVENKYNVSTKLTNNSIINIGIITTKAKYTITINYTNGAKGVVKVGNLEVKSGDKVLTGSTLSIAPTTVEGYTTTATSSTGTIASGKLIIDGNETIVFDKIENSYSVKFNGNGNTGGSMNNQSFKYTESKALTKNTFSREYTVTCNKNYSGSSSTSHTATYGFKRWNVKADNTGMYYNNGEIVSKLSATNGDIVNLYAQWTPGSTILPTPTRAEYNFMGWSESSTATSGITGEYTPEKNIILYATWKPKKNWYSIWSGNGSNKGSDRIYLYIDTIGDTLIGNEEKYRIEIPGGTLYYKALVFEEWNCSIPAGKYEAVNGGTLFTVSEGTMTCEFKLWVREYGNNGMALCLEPSISGYYSWINDCDEELSEPWVVDSKTDVQCSNIEVYK